MTTIVRKKISSAGNVKFVKYSELKAGETLVVGFFQGTELVPSYDKKSQVPQHTFVDEDEKIVKLNSAGQLNAILKNVQPGAFLEVTFLGKEKIKTKDGRQVEANQFEVHELEDQTPAF